MRVLLLLRDAQRALRARPVLALLSVLVLATGTAGVTTIAGLVGSLLLRPLPYTDPDRLVFVLGSDAGSAPGALAPAEMALVREQARSFERLAALAPDDAVVGSGPESRLRHGARVSADLAPTLGAVARAGRLLGAADAGEDVLVLGEPYWREQLGGRVDLIGSSLLLDGRPLRVIGVLGARSRLKQVLGFEPDWWRPLGREAALDSRASLLGIGRLREGVSPEAAGAELAVLQKRLPAGPGGPRTLGVLGLRAGVDPVARVLVALILVAILGIVCVDVGSVLLAGALAREREIAVRQAMGAGRREIFAGLLLEGVLLGLLAAGLGLLLTRLAARALTVLSAGTNAEALSLEFDGWLVGVAVASSLLAGLVAGLAPALHGRRVGCSVLLKEGGPTTTASPRARRLRTLLVASQVALSLTLLTQAALATSSLLRLLSTPRGFSASGVLALPFESSGAAADAVALAAVRALPGVSELALASTVPAAGAYERYQMASAGEGGAGRARPLARGGSPGASPAIAAGKPTWSEGSARVNAVGPRYFDATGIALKAGRPLSEIDDGSVAVVNEELARREGLGAGALGAALEVGGTRRTVVGIVADVRNPPLQVTPRPEVYLAWGASSPRHGWLLVRTRLAAALPLSAEVARAFDDAGGRRTGAVRELDRALAADMGVIRLGTVLLGAVALCALLLTTAGTFGVVSFLSGRRTRELGIRLSLGASVAGLRRLLLLQGLRPVLAGIAVGTVCSIALGRLLASRVHGLRQAEPAVLLGSLLLFTLVLGVACYLPARRATRSDPASALRCE